MCSLFCGAFVFGFVFAFCFGTPLQGALALTENPENRAEAEVQENKPTQDPGK
jgi:hypothetical protein